MESPINSLYFGKTLSNCVRVGVVIAGITVLQSSAIPISNSCGNRVEVLPEGSSVSMDGSYTPLSDVGYEIDTYQAEQALCAMGVRNTTIHIGGVERDLNTLSPEIRSGAVAGIEEPSDYDGNNWFFNLDCHRANALGEPRGYTELPTGERYPTGASCNHALGFEIGDIGLRILEEPQCRVDSHKPGSIDVMSIDCALRVNRAENDLASRLNRTYKFVRR